MADSTPDDPDDRRPVERDADLDDELEDDLDDFDDDDDDGGGSGGLGALLGGTVDMGSLLDSAMQMQQQLMAARDEAAAQVVEGVAGGGAVRITVTGGLEFQSVSISPEVIDPAEVEMLEDLVLAALSDAVRRANALTSGAMGGLGLPGLDGLLGGG